MINVEYILRFIRLISRLRNINALTVEFDQVLDIRILIESFINK